MKQNLWLKKLADYLAPAAISAEERLGDRNAFGWKEALAIGLTVAITLTIFFMRGRLAGLDELGYVGAFLLMMLTSATLVLPAGGLIVIFVLGGTLPSVWLLALVSAIGSAIGEGTGYLAGYSGHNVLARTRMYKKMHAKVERNALWTIFILAVIPTPLFDVAGLAAGALRLAWWRFFVPTAAGKFIKMLIVAIAGSYSVGWIERLL